MMMLDSKQQVLLALYMEYQKDIPKMQEITCTALDMDIEVFNIALYKLQNEGYINGLRTMSADNDKFYHVDISGVILTRDGIELIENKFGLAKEFTAEEKLRHILKKCGAWGFMAMKMFGSTILENILN